MCLVPTANSLSANQRLDEKRNSRQVSPGGNYCIHSDRMQVAAGQDYNTKGTNVTQKGRFLLCIFLAAIKLFSILPNFLPENVGTYRKTPYLCTQFFKIKSKV